jgi:hypothetical protein
MLAGFWSADPDPDGSALILSCWIRIRIQEGKMIHKNRKKYRIFMFLSTGCSLLMAKASPVAWDK